jgi:hypothetical protein
MTAKSMHRRPHTLFASGAEALWHDPEAAGVTDAMIEVLRSIKPPL